MKPHTLAPLLVLALALGAAPVMALTILVPGHTDSLLEVLPSAGANHYGTLAFDAAGVLYATGGLTNNIWRRPVGGTFAVYADVPGTYSLGLVVIGSTLYAGDDGSRILAYDTTLPAPMPTTPVTGIGSVHGMVAGCAGVTLAAATSNGVYSVDPVAGTFTLMGSSFYASGIACHVSGTMILATDYSPNNIMAVTPPSTTTIFRAAVGDDPDGLAVHPTTGDVYVACSASQEMWQINSAGTTATLFGNGFNFDGGTWPTPLAFTPDGTELYWGSVDGAHSIHRIDGFPPVTPPASCMITAPAAAATVTNDVTLVFDADAPGSATAAIAFSWSTDGGTTYAPATAAAASPLANPTPALAMPATAASFIWDSEADGVGSSLVQSTIVRVTVTGVSAPVSCQVTVDVDNTALCAGICGDCNVNGAGPDILDALIAAQIAAALIAPTPTQLGCCDVDATGAVTIIDALRIAQNAAGLPVTLTCL